MKFIVNYLKGKKTYAVCITILIVTLLQYRGIEIPEEVWGALAAMGLAFLRAGVKNIQDLPTNGGNS